MRSILLWLRLSYWLAALADFAIAVLVLIPERVGLTKFEYPMGMTAVIAFSWGILLLLANRKPLKRRWVLIPTFIVVILLTSVGYYASTRELINLNVPSFIFGTILSMIIAFSYWKSRDVKSDG
ncbi:MAG: hypothetical protein QNJ57_13085 [Flavobacteriaceae bacterium]|nr:hypothetical protein [Flavobacteriaceae bacterium]